MLTGVGVAALTAIAARQWHLTRLTPDSLRYLLASNDLVLTEGLREMNAVDLVTRQIGLPALHSMSDLVGRRYLASLGPLFGAFGLGLFVWLAVDLTRGALARRNRWSSLRRPPCFCCRPTASSTTRSISTRIFRRPRIC